MHKTIVILLLVSLVSCGKKTDKQPTISPAAAQEKLVEANRILVKKDQKRIEGTVKRNNWNATETETGLWFEELKAGEGELIKENEIVSMNYTLSLLDGTLLYSSDETGPKTFEVGHGGVESGLEQGVLLCRPGTKARLILPPYLGHGLPGDGESIPARAILVYEIEITGIEK